MDGLITSVGEFLISKGTLGVFVLVLLATCWRLHSLLMVTQEKRVEEALTSSKALSDNSHALDRLSEILKARNA